MLPGDFLARGFRPREERLAFFIGCECGFFDFIAEVFRFAMAPDNGEAGGGNHQMH